MLQKMALKSGIYLVFILVVAWICQVYSSSNAAIDSNGESTDAPKYLSMMSVYEEFARLPYAPREIIEKYENLLMEERSDHHCITSVDRAQDLGKILCADAWKLKDYDNSFLSVQWKTFMSELRETQRNSTNCANFLYYGSFGWRPAVFSWATDIPGTYIAQKILSHVSPLEAYLWVDLFRSSQLYAFTSMRYFVLENYNIPVSYERAQHLYHFKVLLDSTGRGLNSFDNIIEYGAGTGDNVPLIRQARFKGKHFIYDLPEMHLLQQYFLGLSSYPSYVIDSFSNPVDVQQRRTLMSSSLDNLVKHYQHSTTTLPSNDLLIATYSLAESDVVLRNNFISAFSNISYGLIAYVSYFDFVDNAHYFQSVLPALLPNHYICQWRQDPVHLPDHHYAVLMRKDLGEGIICKNHISCSRENYVAGDCIFD